MPDALFIGPLALPPIIVPAAFAFIAGYAFLRLVVPRIATREAVRWISDNSYWAIIAGFLVWKLWPLFRWWDAVLSRPSILLRIPGGLPGTIAGIITALLFLAPGLVRDRSRIRPLAMTVLVASVTFLFSLAIMQSAGLNSAKSGDTDRLLTVLNGSDYAGDDSFYRDTSGNQNESLVFLERPLVLTFWATWCAPCTAELPIKAEFAHLNRESIDYVAVNMIRSETSQAVVEQFVREHRMNYPVALDSQGALTSMFGVRGTPTTVIIDTSGRIRDRWMGPSSLDRLERAIRPLLLESELPDISRQ